MIAKKEKNNFEKTKELLKLIYYYVLEHHKACDKNKKCYQKNV